jgi:hypothetical protein
MLPRRLLPRDLLSGVTAGCACCCSAVLAHCVHCVLAVFRFSLFCHAAHICRWLPRRTGHLGGYPRISSVPVMEVLGLSVYISVLSVSLNKPGRKWGVRFANAVGRHRGRFHWSGLCRSAFVHREHSQWLTSNATRCPRTRYEKHGRAVHSVALRPAEGINVICGMLQPRQDTDGCA